MQKASRTKLICKPLWMKHSRSSQMPLPNGTSFSESVDQPFRYQLGQESDPLTSGALQRLGVRSLPLLDAIARISRWRQEPRPDAYLPDRYQGSPIDAVSGPQR